VAIVVSNEAQMCWANSPLFEKSTYQNQKGKCKLNC